jgi:hypothetical protein
MTLIAETPQELELLRQLEKAVMESPNKGNRIMEPVAFREEYRALDIWTF